jgi:histidinol-phosphate aminotransferase
MEVHFKEQIKQFAGSSYAETEDVGAEFLDCALGCNPFGCTRNIDEVKIAQGLLDRYPHNYALLIEAIQKRWEESVCLSAESIRLAVGSMGVLENVNRMFLERGSKVLGPSPQFTDYNKDVIINGARYVDVVADDPYVTGFDASKIREHIMKQGDDISLIYINNPNNPSGEILPLDDLIPVFDLAGSCGVAVLVDEAYGDYMPDENSAIKVSGAYKNVVVARSFSKGLGIPGLRVGYGVANPAFFMEYDKVTNPFTVNALAIPYAIAALSDLEFIKTCRVKIAESKKRCISMLNKLSVAPTSEQVPIMLLVHPCRSVDLYKLFLSKKILTVSGAEFNGLGKNSVRIRVPRDSEMLERAIAEIEGEL